jgi:3-oxoacyl-[acyl-carrier protein] reductase
MKKFNQISVGDNAQLVHKITLNDVEKFINLTGDDNKLHFDNGFARKTEFKKPVVHGMLGASFISTLIGTKLPGDGALWYSQTLEFLRPVRINDTITVYAEVSSKNDKLKSIELKVEIRNQNKHIVTKGISKVKITELEINEKISKVLDHTKTALVLGATGGVGKETALKLADDGFNIILHYFKNESEVKNIEKIIKEKKRKVIYLKADLLHNDQINDLVSNIFRHFSILDVVVNCATTSVPNVKFTDLEWSLVQQHLDINIKANFYIIKKLLPHFEKQKFGKIVLLTSQATETPTTEWSYYITSKTALNGFVKSLALELASIGVNINLVSPSLIDTDLVSDIPKKIKMLIEAKTPLKRLCTTKDVSNAISFLASSESSFITGETIRLNGGQVMI